MVKSLNEIWKCEVCGNIVEITTVGGGQLVCCGQPMTQQLPSSVDAALEKHVPVIEVQSDGYLVKIGSVPHPMEAAHYIEWIELMVDDQIVARHYFQPGAQPQAFFPGLYGAENKVWAREYCNIHRLWQTNR